MKNKLLLFSVAAFLAGCTTDSLMDEMETPVVPGSSSTRVIHLDQVAKTTEVLVKFKSQYASTVEASVAHAMSRGQYSRSGISNFDNFLEQTKAISFQRVFPVNKYEKRTRLSGLHLWYKVKFETDLSARELKENLLKVPELSTVEFVSPTSLVDGTKQPVWTDLNERTKVFSRSQMDDPGLVQQWHYHNDGTAVPDARPNADINLFKAWERTAGSPSVVVAVVDEYVQSAHPDLESNMWVNEAEANGEKGVDDDGNGYVDDIHGFDFYSNKADGTPGGHGTHVAGTVAATNNNALGVSGIAGGTGKGDGARVMACGAIGADGGNIEMTVLSLKYAADNGAVIAQNSWGYANPDLPWEEDAVFSIEREALDYFINNAGKDENGKVVGPMDGGVVIFAANNSGDIYGSKKFWPAAHPDFIAVSSIGCDYNPAYYTSYGSWVDISAPGGDQSFNTSQGGVLSTCIGSTPKESGYAFYQGTSMACPHVSGVAALVISYARENNLTLTNTQLKDIILSSGRNIDAYFHGEKNYDGHINSPAFYLKMTDYRGLMGNGLLDASLALDRVDQLLGKPSDHVSPAPVGEVELVSNKPESITLKWKITGDFKNDPMQSYSLYYSTGDIQVANGKLVQDKELQGPVMAATKQGAKVGDWMEAEIVGLEANRNYQLAVVGYDQWRMPSSPKIFTCQTQQMPKGDPVSNLKVLNITSSSFIVEWNQTSDFYKRPFKQYEVACSTRPDFVGAKTHEINSTGKPGALLSVNIKRLQPGTVYYIRVIGFNDNSESEAAYVEGKTLDNHLPEITPEFSLPVNLQYWENQSFTFKVSDFENDAWTASLQERPIGWSMTYDKQRVTLTFSGPVSVEGEQELSFLVVDAKGGESVFSLPYKIVGNVAPVIQKNIPNVYIEQKNGKQTLDLSQYFMDRNNEALNYKVTVDGRSVNVIVKEGQLTLEGFKDGLSEVVVRGTDNLSLSVETSFKVMVRSSSADMDLYPNPVRHLMNIRLGKDVNGPIKVKVKNYNGHVLYETASEISPFEPAKINMTGVEAGTLLIEVECQGKIYKGNIVKL